MAPNISTEINSAEADSLQPSLMAYSERKFIPSTSTAAFSTVAMIGSAASFRLLPSVSGFSSCPSTRGIPEAKMKTIASAARTLAT
ncbi:hypothetical protein D3C80_1641510 [compost metagenome]